ncbi:helix-turn-helix domain-containing protein [Streptomyces chiangmaiensis]
MKWGSPEAFESLAHAAAEGAGDQELEELRAQLASALRMRGLMERQQHREKQLRALYQTATDLTALRDVDAVLGAIVRRARELLGVDVAYLSLIDDERQDVYIRVSDGSVSARFQGIRLPMGTGLGGLMVQTAAPYATQDYQHDTGFLHDGPVDASVAEEGIHALLGVPLLLDGKVIGGLLAGNRRPRPFPPEEIALASSLAAHAAVALENARLFAQAQQALDRLNQANQVILEHAASVERAAEAHDRLTTVLLEGGGVSDVTVALTEVLGGTAAILGPDGSALANTGAPLPPLDRRRQAATQARASGHTVELHHPGDATQWIAAAVAGGDHLGTVLLGGHQELSEVGKRILERAAHVAALLLLFHRSLADTEDRVRGDLLIDVITDPQRHEATLRQRARGHRADLDTEHAVVVARTKDVDRQRAAVVAARLAAGYNGLAASHLEDLVLALPHVQPAAAADLVASRLHQVLGYRVTAGAAGPAAGAVSLSNAYRDARRCLEALILLGRQGEAADAGGLGFAGLLLGPQTPHDIHAYIEARLGPLLQHDRQRGSEFLRTLESYFQADRSLALTARTLHVHVNTVSQRLRRITMLLGSRWRDPQNALELQMALQLHRLRPLDLPAGD